MIGGDKQTLEQTIHFELIMAKKNRNRMIMVKLTEEEAKKFKKYADSKHTTLSEVIRQTLHGLVDAQTQSQAA